MTLTRAFVEPRRRRKVSAPFTGVFEGLFGGGPVAPAKGNKSTCCDELGNGQPQMRPGHQSLRGVEVTPQLAVGQGLGTKDRSAVEFEPDVSKLVAEHNISDCHPRRDGGGAVQVRSCLPQCYDIASEFGERPVHIRGMKVSSGNCLGSLVLNCNSLIRRAREGET